MSDDRVTSRASHLLPEELVTGSEDPREQASALLAESELRTAEAVTSPDPSVERRTSEESAE
jgi:hypothetical protein